jgi:hypothetical protein
MQNHKSSSDKQISIDICHNRYNTVPIRSDLPKIPKYYKEEPLQDLPPNDFWMKKLDPLYVSHELSSSASISTQKYEIQYNIINGPCKFVTVLT